MAYIEGHTRASVNKPVAEKQAAQIIRQLAEALQDAQNKGIIHRDLKPVNVMIDEKQNSIIMDFGLARSEVAEVRARLRTPDMVFGFGRVPARTPPQLSSPLIEGCDRTVSTRGRMVKSYNRSLEQTRDTLETVVASPTKKQKSSRAEKSTPRIPKRNGVNNHSRPTARNVRST